MREIIFRGKRSDTDEWAYGLPFMSLDGTKIGGIEVSPRSEDLHLIDANTLGQYTGLHDKNGKRVFEGDVIRCWYHRAGKEDLVTEEQVVFHQGAFVAHATNGTAKWWVHLPNDNGCKPLDKVYIREVEIIGNIHDDAPLCPFCDADTMEENE